MKSFVEAKLIDFKTIQIAIVNPNKDIDYIFTLLKDLHNRRKIEGKRISEKDNIYVYEFKFNQDIELGFDYRISITHLGIFPLNVNGASLLKEFDDKFAYQGDDLGCTYTRNKTTFAVWAPLASFVQLILDGKEIIEMTRTDKGVYRKSINRNLKGHTYNYYVTNSGVSTLTLDPYGKASTLNSKRNVVTDFKSLQINMHDKHPFKMKSYLDAIIYEGSVRDLTSDKNTNIKYKGKFLGLAEEGKVNNDGISVGFDYIKNLGITHLQLLPIFDFATIDEEHPESSYNWGYDPLQYFVPEGSYASNPNDPNSRISDLLTMISKYHEAGIRIVMDVVFNHVYEHQHSSLEAIVPNYFFRRTKEGVYYNCSGCGNDIATERPMARKLIVDVCKWWVSFYHIDGFRFDLMGLIDIDTMNLIKKEVLSIKKDFMFYGEGWNMMGDSKVPLANSNNSFKLKDFAFFNDFYRDVAIGNVGGKYLGYALDNIECHHLIKDAMTGSSFSLVIPPKYPSILSSINFVECHDNETLYDKLSLLNPTLTESEKFERIKFTNSLVMYSIGVPFFHAGQEIGLSKKGYNNTYNSGDELNYFNYSLLKDRMELVNHFKKLCSNRKKIRIFHETNMKLLDKNIFIEDIDKNSLLFTYRTRVSEDKNIHIMNLLINPSKKGMCYNKNITDVVVIPPISMTLKEDKND